MKKRQKKDKKLPSKKSLTIAEMATIMGRSFFYLNKIGKKKTTLLYQSFLAEKEREDFQKKVVSLKKEVFNEEFLKQELRESVLKGLFNLSKEFETIDLSQLDAFSRVQATLKWYDIIKGLLK